MTSPTERPRDRMFAYVADRIFSLETRAKMECKSAACGSTDDDGVSACTNSKDCGEKTMLQGWRRELQFMRDVKALLEVLEHNEMKKGGKR